MKLTRPKHQKFQQNINLHHTKNASQDFSNLQNHPNFFFSKFINKNPKLKNESLIKDNLSNIKNSIQNIFSNEERKEKAIQYLMNKSKDNKTSFSNINKNRLNKSEEIRDIESSGDRSPYNYKKFNVKPITSSYDISKSNVDIKIGKNKREDIKCNYRYKNPVKNISEDEPLNQNDIKKDNKFYQNNNNFISDSTSNKYVNKKRGTNYSYIDSNNANNLYNASYMAYNTQRNKNTQNITYDNLENYTFKNAIKNIEIKDDFNRNQYNDYKLSYITNIKRSILKKNIDNITIDISDSENNNKENNNKNSNIQNSYYTNDTFYANRKNKYIRRDKNDKVNEQESKFINFIKKSPLKPNDSIINNKPRNTFYIHKKNLGYKKLNQKKILKDDLSISSNIKNTSCMVKENNNNKNENNYIQNEKVINRYDRNVKKIPYANTFGNNSIFYNRNDLSLSQANNAQFNIDKFMKKKYNNSPYNSIKDDNENNDIDYKNDFLKSYEKRNSYKRSPLKSFTNQNIDFGYDEINNDIDNKKGVYMNRRTNNNSNILNKNKLIFNDEEEIIDFLRKKYNKRNVDEIFNRFENGMASNELDFENNYRGLMTTEEGNKIKKKNEELSTEIQHLIYENKQYKKELNDMKNKFNDLSKEITTIKGKKY